MSKFKNKWACKITHITIIKAYKDDKEIYAASINDNCGSVQTDFSTKEDLTKTLNHIFNTF